MYSPFLLILAVVRSFGENFAVRAVKSRHQNEEHRRSIISGHHCDLFLDWSCFAQYSGVLFSIFQWPIHGKEFLGINDRVPYTVLWRVKITACTLDANTEQCIKGFSN